MYQPEQPNMPTDMAPGAGSANTGPMGPLLDINTASTTPSLDLPATLQGLFGAASPQVGVNPGAVAPLGGAPAQPDPNAPLFDLYSQPVFAQGGMVDPSMPMMGGGMPQDIPQGMPMGVGVNPQQGEPVTEQDVQMFMQQHPQQVQQIAMQLQQLMQTGEVNMQQLNMAEQLATVALQNPQMYPQMRQFAVSQGLAEEQDISPQYDQGLLFSVILAARAVKSGAPQGGMSMTDPGMMGGQEEMQSFADGGFVTPGSSAKKGGYAVGPGTGTSDSIPIRVSAGEYVIPAHIVQSKGKEFFDSMLDKYKK
jgi:hypothetical protein